MNPQDCGWDCAGWFGKIPALGDFVTRRLPASFVQPWDAWLSEQLFEAECEFRDQWDATYRRAPMYCFSLGRMVVDHRAWAGILAPSVDRVGRQFPVTIALSRPYQSAEPLAESWWQGLMEVARCALETSDSEGVDAALWTLLKTHHAHVTDPDCRRAASPPAIVDEGKSLWWPRAPDPTDAAPLIFSALPRGRDFRSLLTGKPA